MATFVLVAGGISVYKSYQTAQSSVAARHDEARKTDAELYNLLQREIEPLISGVPPAPVSPPRPPEGGGGFAL